MDRRLSAGPEKLILGNVRKAEEVIILLSKDVGLLDQGRQDDGGQAEARRTGAAGQEAVEQPIRSCRRRGTRSNRC